MSQVTANYFSISLIRLTSHRPTRFGGRNTANCRFTRYRRSKRDKRKQKTPEVVSNRLVQSKPPFSCAIIVLPQNPTPIYTVQIDPTTKDELKPCTAASRAVDTNFSLDAVAVSIGTPCSSATCHVLREKTNNLTCSGLSEVLVFVTTFLAHENRRSAVQ